MTILADGRSIWMCNTSSWVEADWKMYSLDIMISMQCVSAYVLQL